ncbi:MAG: nodulation protein NfeD [Candidatus Aminicenantales bacterium]
MRARILLFLLLFCPALSSAAILKIAVDAPIHPITAEYIVRTIERADREGASLVIMSLNTPGGLDSSMRQIIEKIVNARTPIAAYVAPSGARAASAGFFIGIACDIFAMAPGTNTGAAHPVGLSITGQAMDKTMEDKVTHDAASYIKTLAEKRGRNMGMAEDAVRKSLSYTEQEALKGGLIDIVARSDRDIIEAFDGKRLKRFNGEETTLSLKKEPVIPIPMSFRQQFLLTISNPNLAYILLMIGLLGLYFEFAHPGAILPGVLGGICLLLAVFSFQILPINYVGLMLILLAIVLFVLEVKVHSYGMLSLGGITAMVIGSVMLINSPIPELRPSLRVIIPMALGISMILIFLVYLVVRAHARRAFTGKEGMVGELGIAQTDLNPSGKVFVHGEIWEAEAAEPVARGEKVRVVAVLDTLKVRVRKA